MNSRQEFDDQLRDWADLGDERLPTHYLEAALAQVETTRQRGAGWWPLEGILMKLKPVAPILGVAAVVVLALAGYRLLGGANLGGPSAPTPTPRTFTSADLPGMVLTQANAPEGMIVDATATSLTALQAPLKEGGATMPLTGFEDALMTNLNTTDAGGYVTWSALYETGAQAEVAYDLVINEFESADGWGLEPSAQGPSLGNESAFYEGPTYAFDTARTYIWRANNLLLAAVAVGDVAQGTVEGDRLREIAQGMDRQTR